MKTIFGAAAAAAMLTMSTVAVAAPANPASSLSLAGSVRAPAAVKGANKANAGTSTFINIGILAALVVVVLVATGGSDDKADSN